MTIKCLVSEKQATQYYFKYTLDDTKDAPAYIREYTYGIVTPQGMTDSEYVSMMQRELPLLCQEELNQMASPTPAPTPLTGF